MKRRIRLTEGDLHRIVKESVNIVLNEGFFDKMKSRFGKKPQPQPDEEFDVWNFDIRKTKDYKTVYKMLGDLAYERNEPKDELKMYRYLIAHTNIPQNIISIALTDWREAHNA